MKFQCGLNHEEQNFKIFIFNNGNLKCSDLVYKIHIYRSYPGIEGGKQFLSETVKRFQGINGGDIESLIDENLIEKSSILTVVPINFLSLKYIMNLMLSFMR